MLSFSTVLTIVGDTHEVIELKRGNKFHIYECVVGKTEIPLLVAEKYATYGVGTVVIAKEIRLTSVKKMSESSSVVVLRLIEGHEVREDERIELPRYLNVIVNGKLIKGSKSELKKVGERRKTSFLPATFAILNENGERFDLFLACFSKLAEEINSWPTNTYMDIEARLLPREVPGTWELNLTRIIQITSK